MLSQENGSKPDERGRGVSNILRAYKGQPKFSGLYEEDLEALAENYEETADSCDATDLEKSKEMFAMLHGSARTLFNRKGKYCKSFEEGMDLIRSWYNSEDKEGRLLAEWHQMSLSKDMEEKPENPQTSVFRDFVTRLMSLQNQLRK